MHNKYRLGRGRRNSNRYNGGCYFATIRNSKKQFVELQRQNFENALFSLLDRLEKIHNQVKYQVDIDAVSIGSDGFTSAWNDFKRRMDIELYQDDNSPRFQERFRTEESKKI